jgi:hypothetical protein
MKEPVLTRFFWNAFPPFNKLIATTRDNAIVKDFARNGKVTLFFEDRSTSVVPDSHSRDFLS